MRKFTKDHNDLNWLFPDPSTDYEGASEIWFDRYEDLAEDLFKTCYGEQETFTKDDLIDAFMKGASEAHAFLSEKMISEKTMSDLHKFSLEKSDELEALMKDVLEKMQNEKK